MSARYIACLLAALAAVLPAGGAPAADPGPAVRLVAAPEPAEEGPGEDSDEGLDESSDEDADEDAATARSAPSAAPTTPSKPLQGKPRPTTTAPPTSTTSAPTRTPGIPPGWDPAAEAAKWAEVARTLREKRRQQPDPRVVDSFASQLSGERRGPGRTKRSEPVASDVDGCDRAYGTAGQCIPTTLPPGVADLCAYLASRGFPPVRVNGADTLGVDPDGNRVACG
ncbi:hypothetical protein [Pseudonocardia sp.]|uniref:hypothetical protein n=1 Tax=Pseudonocardia sp. TaxID=60912 RepID=UPI003D0B6308